MKNSYQVFGSHAFRKWPEKKTGHSPFNRALFESWSVALAGHSAKDVSRKKVDIVRRARKLMTSDAEYLTAITTSTGDLRKIQYRFRKAREAVGLEE